MDLPPQNRQPVHPLRGLFALGILLLIVFGVWWAYSNPEFFNLLSKTSPRLTHEGTLFLGLSPDADGKVPFNIYSLNLSSLELGTVLSSVGDESYATGSFSPDGEKVAFSEMTPNEDGTWTSLIFTSHKDGSAIKQVAASTSFFIQKPQWSPDGLSIVFEGFPQSSGFGKEDGQGTKLFVVKSDDESSSLPQAIGGGRHPQFLPSGDIVAVPEDEKGVLSLFLKNEKWEQLNIFSTFEGVENSQALTFDVLEDGTRLVLSAPSLGELLVLKVISWNPFSAEIVGTFSGQTFQPTFSPDGQSVAFIERSLGQYGATYSISILDTASLAYQKVFTLNDFYNKSMYLNDWVQ